MVRFHYYVDAGLMCILSIFYQWNRVSLFANVGFLENRLSAVNRQSSQAVGGDGSLP
jgi:hypothetical protein